MSDDRSFMNDFDSEHDELAFVKADRTDHLLLSEMSMRRSSSKRSYTINTFFDALVHCTECQTSRPMAIKTIKPGRAGSRDIITYECSQCGATTSRFGE